MQTQKHNKLLSRKRGRPSKEFIAKYGRPTAKPSQKREVSYDQQLKWCDEERVKLLIKGDEEEKHGDLKSAGFYRAVAELSTYEMTYEKGGRYMQEEIDRLAAEYFCKDTRIYGG